MTRIIPAASAAAAAIIADSMLITAYIFLSPVFSLTEFDFLLKFHGFSTILDIL